MDPGQMAKVVAVHRLELLPGVDAAAFEQFVQTDLFPALEGVFSFDKMITHHNTSIRWMEGKHLLLRPSPASDPRVYLWTIVAPFSTALLATDEHRQKVEREANHIAEEFFDRGTISQDQAAIMLKPFATRLSLEIFIEAASWVRSD